MNRLANLGLSSLEKEFSRQWTSDFGLITTYFVGLGIDNASASPYLFVSRNQNMIINNARVTILQHGASSPVEMKPFVLCPTQSSFPRRMMIPMGPKALGHV
eukprot:scaffold17205_cov186-Amphora_coffeaeformis.AAC.10